MSNKHKESYEKYFSRSSVVQCRIVSFQDFDGLDFKKWFDHVGLNDFISIDMS